MGNFSSIPWQSGGFYKGAPSVIFSAEEECKLAGNFQFTVVGRGSKHISIREAEDCLIKGGYKEFKLQLLSPKEIIFIFKHEEDYLRWFHRRRWTIKGNLINLTKWTPEHSSSKDCPIIPLWVEVSKLPLHLHDHNVLYSIASSLGKPLELDSNSVIGVFPDRTRFCVEMDVSISKAPKIHVRLGAKDLWLPCSYENHTPYCSSCSRFGHAPKDCRIKGPENLTVAAPSKVVEDSPFPDLSYLKVDNFIGCMDIVPFVPLSHNHFDDEKPLVTLPGRKDDCWIHPNMVCGLEGHEKDAQEGAETPIYCHSEGEEGAKPFINEPKGSLFTLSGVRSQGRTWHKLDRVLLNLDTMASFEDLALTHLPRANSDHKPLLLFCLDTPPYGAKPFKFLNAWTQHDSFLATIQASWSSTPTIGGMRGLVLKLKTLKLALKDWNSSHFGNIFLKLKEAEEIASKAQETYELDPSDLNCEGAQLANAQLVQAVNREVSYWKQKENVKWLEKGDTNSKVFQAFVRGKRQRLNINHIISSEGRGLSFQDYIKQEYISHFQKAFKSTPCGNMEPILSTIHAVITQEDNAFLTSIPCMEEEFFLGLPITKGYGSTFISLIPKKENPKTFDDFRPISLSTFMSKINTKLLANRLKTLLPKIISEEQAAFQKGKSCDDHILLAKEAIHHLDKKTFGGNVIIKVDMAKAFDRMEWSYIEHILKGFGFSDGAINILMANLKNTFLSILLNGAPTGFFKMERGVKQGDPLSPLLFIIGGEGLCRMINKHMSSHFINRFNVGSIQMVSQLIYADDLIIFSKGDIRNLLKIKAILREYFTASGQDMNNNKSRFYTS
ncbi:unnamed protein product [Cuscuta campestris]|uniref:Reverse transcriptase domain-containing protein n=1 Tax=Cuscuta campestris TaxID=132261 RepID=A0A484MXA4_9ASTE|nr:unnamed protein product [Cuscuta campestris]